MEKKSKLVSLFVGLVVMFVVYVIGVTELEPYNIRYLFDGKYDRYFGNSLVVGIIASCLTLLYFKAFKSEPKSKHDEEKLEK